MSSSYIRVVTNSGSRVKWRTFGGNRPDVRDMGEWYKNASYPDILKKHPYMTMADWYTLSIEYVTKNRKRGGRGNS